TAGRTGSRRRLVAVRRLPARIALGARGRALSRQRVRGDPTDRCASGRRLDGARKRPRRQGPGEDRGILPRRARRLIRNSGQRKRAACRQAAPPVSAVNQKWNATPARTALFLTKSL